MLAVAQRRGFVGPGPIGPHVDRALDLAGAIAAPLGPAMDLGSGAGLPGLPLALVWLDSSWVLLEASTTRADFLCEAVLELELADRVSVVAARAETAGRGPLRGQFDLVVARSFAKPAVTAECGSPFLRPQGRLVVAEPPEAGTDRWDVEGLMTLGLRLGTRLTDRTSYQVLVQERTCPDRFPRRVGIPAKRPVF